MSFDGLFTRGIVHELKGLESGRISKIYQPSKQEILFHIRAFGRNTKLLMSTHPTYARLHETTHTYESPSNPPMFCMLLRKHLEGGIIEQIEQIGLERVVKLHIRSRNEIGDSILRYVYIEIMGRHSNLILTNEENIILDSIKHLSPSTNSYRTVLPGFPYVAPPPQNKTNPFEVTELDAFVSHIDFLQGKIDKQLVNQFSGFSPVLAKEILFDAYLPTEQNLFESFFALTTRLHKHDYQPSLMKQDEKESFYCLPLKTQGAVYHTYQTLSNLLDRFYFGKAERDRVKQQEQDLERFIQNELQKNQNKIEKLQATLDKAEKADIYQKYGELLTANLYAIKRGDNKATVIDYYSEEGEEIVISLDARKTPSQNAQAYFTKYQKAKNSIDIVNEQIRLTYEEIAYFDSLLQQVQSATLKDIEGIREELEEGGYLRNRRKKQQKGKKPTKPVLDEYTSSDGSLILVGKNNKQNEFLTNKLAHRDDLWFHVKDIPGSHVVIRDTRPSETTIKEAAILSAYYSKAKHSSSVPVDYTQIRHVKKPSGSKPGFVTYDQQRTVYVTPNEDLVLKLKR